VSAGTPHFHCSRASNRAKVVLRNDQDEGWKSGRQPVILLGMSAIEKGASAPAGWLESLARSKAQIAAGEQVPLLPVLERLRATAERLEAALGEVEDGSRPSAAE
jgi:hypothetical protein